MGPVLQKTYVVRRGIIRQRPCTIYKETLKTQHASVFVFILLSLINLYTNFNKKSIIKYIIISNEYKHLNLHLT